MTKTTTLIGERSINFPGYAAPLRETLSLTKGTQVWSHAFALFDGKVLLGYYTYSWDDTDYSGMSGEMPAGWLPPCDPQDGPQLAKYYARNSTSQPPTNTIAYIDYVDDGSLYRYLGGRQGLAGIPCAVERHTWLSENLSRSQAEDRKPFVRVAYFTPTGIPLESTDWDMEVDRTRTKDTVGQRREYIYGTDCAFRGNAYEPRHGRIIRVYRDPQRKPAPLASLVNGEYFGAVGWYANLAEDSVAAVYLGATHLLQPPAPPAIAAAA